MKVIEVAPDDLIVSEDMRRSGSSKQFEERLRASIEEIGLAEPIKVALMPSGKYLVVDGLIRLRAITAIRKANPSRFETVSAYLVDYDRRYEIRFQTDIYQDLLPSQLATLVEHLHRTERVRKTDIARYIGVAPTTLRNYTGLWRLMQRGGLFAQIVDLMDVGVIPASNPFAWLRLTDAGIRLVLEQSFSEGEPPEAWIEERVLAARQGQVIRYIITFVETVTGGLAAEYYREDEDLRTVKRDLGLRRAAAQAQTALSIASSPEPSSWDPSRDHAMPKGLAAREDAPVSASLSSQTQRPAAKRNHAPAVRHLDHVCRESSNPVLQTAARSLRKYLQ